MEKTHFLGTKLVIYGVEDLDKAKKWYADALGVSPYAENPYYAGFKLGEFELGLNPNQKPFGGHHMGTLLYWEVAGIEEEIKRLVALGAEVVDPAREVGAGRKVASVADPFGNVLGLLEDAPKV